MMRGGARTFAPDGLELPVSLAGTLPDAIAPGYRAAHEYCRRLAREHYENFHVGTFLFPKSAREHAYNFYAYCRWSDDLADETGDPAQSLRLLQWWRRRLDRTFEGRPDHPVFVALAHTINACELPQEPFHHLLDAFELDQRKFRYATFDELLDYCRGSANPVGRIVLRLLGYHDATMDRLSDFTCTALQLANHWQDIENDLRRGRIYVPLEDMERYHVNEEDLALSRASDEVRRLVAFEVDRTRDWFRKGQDLCRLVRGRARFDIELFTRGGLAILDAIAAQDHDVLSRRPTVGRLRKFGLLSSCLVREMFGGGTR